MALLAAPSTWSPALLEVTIIVSFPYLFYIQGTPDITYKNMRRLLAFDFQIEFRTQCRTPGALREAQKSKEGDR